MKNVKHLSSIAALAIIWTGSVTPSWAGSIAGTFAVEANIQEQPFLAGQPGNITYIDDVPATIGFSLTGSSQDYFEFTSSVVSFDITANGNEWVENIVDGNAFLSNGEYHVYSFNALLRLSLIDGNPNGVRPSGLNYGLTDDNGDGENYIVTFGGIAPSSLPEPSSLVMAVSGALLVLGVALGRGRRRRQCATSTD
jgi:hypothetical protein